MTTLATTFLVALASAFLPIIPIEAYLGGAITQTSVSSWWLVVAATVGQMGGKIVIFELGRQSLEWAWVRKLLARHNAERWLDRLTALAGRHRFAADGIVFVSAFIGLPPFAVVSILAGQLRVSLMRFVLWGTMGRFLRFGAVVLGVEQVIDLL